MELNKWPLLDGMEHWEARADYDDGTFIVRHFPYRADGNYHIELEEQYKIEYWLICHHPDINWFSVVYCEE